MAGPYTLDIASSRELSQSTAIDKGLQQREVATPPGPTYLATWDLLMIGPIFKRLTTSLLASLSFYALQDDRIGRRRGYSYVWPRL